MRSQSVYRSPFEIAAEDILVLSSALSKHQSIEIRDKITIARRIGFAIGLELASRESSEGNTAIETQISSLFAKLGLETPTLHNWDPVVFVSHSIPHRNRNTDSDAAKLEAAFGDGVLEGLVWRQENHRTYVRRSMLFKDRCPRQMPESVNRA